MQVMSKLIPFVRGVRLHLFLVVLSCLTRSKISASINGTVFDTSGAMLQKVPSKFATSTTNDERTICTKDDGFYPRLGSPDRPL